MDSHHFRDAVRRGEPILLDGGLATQLEAQGNDLSDALWSARLLIEAPHEIMAAHRAFYGAGARVATTASYQATFEGFAARGLDRAAAEALLRRSVELAMQARDQAVADGIGGAHAENGGTHAQNGGAHAESGGELFVAASIGPYGAMLADGSEYRGNYGRTVAELRDFHRDRLRVLASTDADVLAVETIPEVPEAEAVIQLLGEVPGSAAWVSFSCADGSRLRSGAPIEEGIAAVADAPGVVAVGVNCTAPEHIEELIGRIRATTALPVVVYPNSGEGWDAVLRRWTAGAGGRVDGEVAAGWRRSGAAIVGGCCRVAPSQIRAMSEALIASAG